MSGKWGRGAAADVEGAWETRVRKNLEILAELGAGGVCRGEACCMGLFTAVCTRSRLGVVRNAGRIEGVGGG